MFRDVCWVLVLLIFVGEVDEDEPLDSCECEGLVYFYAEGENLDEESYPVIFFSISRGKEYVHIPIKSSKYGSIIKVKLLRGNNLEPISIKNIEFRGRK